MSIFCSPCLTHPLDRILYTADLRSTDQHPHSNIQSKTNISIQLFLQEDALPSVVRLSIKGISCQKENLPIIRINHKNQNVYRNFGVLFINSVVFCEIDLFFTKNFKKIKDRQRTADQKYMIKTILQLADSQANADSSLLCGIIGT